MFPIFSEFFRYFVNFSDILWIFPIFCESFQYFVNFSNILWIFPILCEFFQYHVNHSNILWIFPIFCEFFQHFWNFSNILWIHKMVELFIIYWNLSKMSSTTTTTIFKLIGPCEILSHGQKFNLDAVCCHYEATDFIWGHWGQLLKLSPKYKILAVATVCLLR